MPRVRTPVPSATSSASGLAVRSSGSRAAGLRAARRPTRQIVAPISANAAARKHPGLECLQRPVVAWRLVGDEQLQVMRERAYASEEGAARQARWALGGAGAGVLRQARRDRRAGADEQIVQLRGAEGVVGAIDERGRGRPGVRDRRRAREDVDARRAPEEADVLPLRQRAAGRACLPGGAGGPRA